MKKKGIDQPDDVLHDHVVIMIDTLTHIIGKLDTVEGRQVIKRPRLLATTTKDGKIGVQMITLLGEPEYMSIPKGAMWWRIENPNLIKAYIHKVSGVTVI